MCEGGYINTWPSEIEITFVEPDGTKRINDSFSIRLEDELEHVVLPPIL